MTERTKLELRKIAHIELPPHQQKEYLRLWSTPHGFGPSRRKEALRKSQ